MRPVPANQLNPRVKIVWRITHLLVVLVLYGLAIMAPLMVGIMDGFTVIVKGVLVALAAIAVVVAVIYVGVWPQVSYMRWRYELGEHELDIARGIIWRKRFIIPFVRVQNTDTNQGPLLRLFGLSSVTVSTAAGTHTIPGLRNDEADQLRDLIAVQARLAQEDV